jgi:hypothetical protein
MIHVEKMIDEMDDLEADFLMPFNVSLLEDYWFAMENVNDNGNWLGYIVHKDGDELPVAYNASNGMTKYAKKTSAYKPFVDDANKIFPLDSCAIDTMSALLVLCEANNWDEVEDDL